MMSKPMVYVVHGWEAENIDSILRQVKKKYSDNGTQQNDFICIGSSCLLGTNSVSSLTAYLINIYRTHGEVKVDRTTILSADDAMLGLQLCLADINLQATGEFDALLSDVLTVMNCVAERKLKINEKEIFESKELGITDSVDEEQKKLFEKYQKFLESSVYVDLYDLLNFYKDQCSSLDEEVKCLNDKSFIIFDYPVNVVEKEMFSFLCSTRDITNIIVKESSLEDNEVNLKFQSVTYSTDLLESYSLQPSTLKNNQLKLSPTQKYIQQIFLSYIDLLVNSSSSISLARVINIPDREIDHHAFTVLKRRANKSNLSMYQLAISLVMKIRLGGKGYAPDQNDPLMMYVKGLSQFVNLLQNLHTIVEDEPDVRLACQRVVKLLKNTILKSRESLSRKPAVEEMAEKIKEDIKTVHKEIELRLQKKLSLPTNQRGSKYKCKTLQVLQALLDQHVINTSGTSDVSILSDVFLTQGTPLRFPSLLSQFRSPEQDATSEKIQPLTERLSEHKSNKQIIPHHKSCMSWVTPSMNEHIPVTNVEYVQPSTTLVCPASSKKIYTSFSINEKENVPSNSLSTDNKMQSKEWNQSKEKGFKVKETKRKKSVIKSDLPKKKCCKRLLPQIKGQTTLNFFIRK